MGQKSNTLTLKKTQKSLSFQGNVKESKNFLYGVTFLSFLEQLLHQKNVTLTDRTLNFVNNEVYLSLTLFFKTTKLKIYKKKYIRSLKLSKKQDYITRFIVSEFSLLKSSLISLNLRVINKEVNEKLAKFLYIKTRRFIKTLLTRRFSLFADFIKTTSLFCENKISISAYLILLAQIFRVLRKKSHSRFLFFLRELFDLLIINKTKKKLSLDHDISGMKFIIKGKLRGKTRASSSCIQAGPVNIQSIEKKICFAKVHVYSLYGVFGFRLWVYRC
jgi:hypothetical protein